jgi:hypothetical protein
MQAYQTGVLGQFHASAALVEAANKVFVAVEVVAITARQGVEESVRVVQVGVLVAAQVPPTRRNRQVGDGWG